MDITFINVGYGESILITCEEPGREDGLFVMLIDSGSDMDSEYVGNSGRIRAADFLWNPNTAPRSGVTLRIDEAGITWHLC